MQEKLLIKEEKDRSEAKYKTANVDDRIEQVCSSLLMMTQQLSESPALASGCLEPNLWLITRAANHV